MRDCDYKHMEDIPTINEALVYDPERLDLFYSRVVYQRNYPKPFKPDKGVHVHAFIDAIIGLYEEDGEKLRESEPEVYALNLARIAFALDFLQGKPYGELSTDMKETFGSKAKNVREQALSVAGDAARTVRDTVLPTEVPNNEIAFETHDISVFEKLDDFIIDLFELGVISSSKAKAMLLLFEQRPSSASKVEQDKVLADIRFDLQKRLKHTTLHQPKRKDEILDRTFAEGAAYMNALISANDATKTLEYAVALSEMMNDDKGIDDHKKHVLGHIGYVLNVIHTPNTQRTE